MIPLACLKNEIFTELLKIAEEEFGVEQSGPITLPCDSNFMEYVLSMIKRGPIANFEKALIMSLPSCRYSSFLREDQEHISQQLYISSF